MTLRLGERLHTVVAMGGGRLVLKEPMTFQVDQDGHLVTSGEVPLDIDGQRRSWSVQVEGRNGSHRVLWLG